MNYFKMLYKSTPIAILTGLLLFFFQLLNFITTTIIKSQHFQAHRIYSTIINFLIALCPLPILDTLYLSLFFLSESPVRLLTHLMLLPIA